MKIMYLMMTLLISFPAFAEHKVVEVGVNGMVCDFCAQGIKKQFKKEKAVTKVDVDLDNKKVTLHLHHELKIKDELIKTKLKDAGYEVRTIARKDN